MFIDEEMEQIYASTGKLSDVIKTLVQNTLPDECKAKHIQHADYGIERVVADWNCLF